MENEVKNEEKTLDEEKTIMITPIEEKKEQQPKRKGHGPLYWVIVIIGMGLIVYLSMGIGEKLGRYAELESGSGNTTKEEANSNENSDTNTGTEVSNSNTTAPETAKDSEIENFDAAKVSKGLNDNFNLAFVWNDFSLDGTNILDNSEFRNFIVIQNIQSEAKEIKSENIQPGISYVDYETFNKKHIQIFGGNYSTQKEITKDEDIIAVIGENKVIWLLSGIPSDEVVMTAKAIKYNETSKTYIITGEWKQKQTGGNFAVEYNVSNGNRTLKSVKLGNYNSQF